MPLTGAVPEGRTFFCPHCGALYAVTHTRVTSPDSNVAKCVVCGKSCRDGTPPTSRPSSSFIGPRMPERFCKRRRI